MDRLRDMWHDPIARKKLLIYGGGGLLLIIIIIIIAVVATRGSSDSTFHGRYVLDQVPLVDGHNDLPYSIYLREQNLLEHFNFHSNLSENPKWNGPVQSPVGDIAAHTDLVKLIEGKVGGQFWVAYADCGSNYKDSVSITLEQIDVIKRLIDKYSDYMTIVTTGDGIWDAFNEKKIASLIGVEGGHSIDSRMSIIRLYYELGVRYMTLTHNCNTPWADCHLANATYTVGHNGLTDFGKNVVLEMNRLGMMVDMSHISTQTMRQVLDVTKAPVIFSHSTSNSKYSYTRNVEDDVIIRLVQNKGIIMVPFGVGFLGPKGANITIDTVVEHLDHIKSLTNSTEYVGIGADYDGVAEVPVGLENVSKYPDLFDALAIGSDTREAWSRDDLANLASGNLIRVMKAVEKFRDDNKKAPNDAVILLKEAAISVQDFEVLQIDTTCRTANARTVI